jgi:hypothetical protein
MTPSDRAALRRQARHQRAHRRRLCPAWQRWWRLREALTRQPSDSRWVVVCAYCHRLRLPGGLWRAAPPRMADRPHIGFEMTHGACDGCLARLSKAT